jgi:WD40 repeat protein/serine/threonine protein kinase
MTENVEEETSSDSATVRQDQPSESENDYPGSALTLDPVITGKSIGDYELIRQIGRGGMGVVFEARQRTLDRRVALKILPLSGALDRRAVKRFQNEAWAAAQLEHRNIVPVYQIGEERGIHYYAMQYVEGGDLGNLISSLKLAASSGSTRKNNRSTFKLAETAETAETSDTSDQAATPDKASASLAGWSSGETLASPAILQRVASSGSTADPKFIDSFIDLSIQVADALNFAHELGIVHRDIKPSNLLIDSEGIAHVADFGLAQFDDRRGGTATGALVGTCAYMSPEQAMGKQRVSVDHRSDIFSLGVTLYELLTLRRAFVGESREEILRKVILENPVSPRKIDPRIPVALETILMKAIAKNPIDRYQTAAELADDLGRFRDKVPIKAQKPTASQRLIQWARANRQLAASVASSFVIATIASIVIAIAFWNSWYNTALALESEKHEKEKVNELLLRSESLRLARDAALQLDEDPTLALLLGIESARRREGVDANNMIHAARSANHELQVLPCDFPVGKISFNGDGSRLLATATKNAQLETPRGAVLWDVRNGRQLHQFESEHPIVAAAYSPDNARILTLSVPPADAPDQQPASTLTLWDEITHRDLTTIKGTLLTETHDALFDPPGRKMVLPTGDNTATIFDCIGGHELVVLSGHEQQVVFAGFDPTGRYVVTTSDDNTIRVWDAESGKTLHQFVPGELSAEQKGKCQIESVDFRPDGLQFATASNRFGVQLWSLQTGKRVSTPFIKGNRCVYWPDNMQVSVYSRYGTAIQTRLVTDGRLIRETNVAGHLGSVAIAPDSDAFAVGPVSSTRVSLWRLADDQPFASLAHPGAMINDLAFSPQSDIFAAASSDRTVRIFHVRDGKARKLFAADVDDTIVRPVADVTGEQVAFPILGGFYTGSSCDNRLSGPSQTIRGRLWSSPGASKRFASTDGNRLSLHDAVTGKVLGTITGAFGEFRLVAINPDGDRVVAFDRGPNVTLWKPDEGRRIPAHVGSSSIDDLQFCPDGQRFAAAGSDGIVRIWDADAATELATLDHDAMVTRLIFSVDGKRLATITNQRQIVIWNLDSYQRIVSIDGGDTPISDACFNADASRLATFDELRTTEIGLWDATSGKQLHRLKLQGRCHVAAHPSEREFLVLSETEGAFLWRPESNRRITLTGQPRTHGCYSADGKQIYVCSDVPWNRPKTNDAIRSFLPNVVQRWSREGLQAESQLELPTGTDRKLSLIAGRVITTALHRTGIAVNDVATGAETARLTGHCDAIADLAFTPDGKTLLTGGRDGQVGTWNRESADDSLNVQLTGSPVSRVVPIDNQTALVAHGEGQISRYSLSPLQRIDQWTVGDAPIAQLDVSRDGALALAISNNRTLRVYDLNSNDVVKLGLDLTSCAWAEFSPRTDHLLAIPFDATLTKEPDDGRDASHSFQVLVAPIAGDAPVEEIHFSSPVVTSLWHPTNHGLVTLTKDGRATFFDLTSKSVSKVLKLSGDEPLAMAIDRSGSWLAALRGGSVSYWRIDDGLRWLSIPGAGPRLTFSALPGRLTPSSLQRFAPFVPGPTTRVLLRSGTRWSAHVLDEAIDEIAVPRSLTAAEQNRFETQPQDVR